MQSEAESLHGLRLEHDILALDGDAVTDAVGMRSQLLLDQHAQRGAVPIVGDEKIVGAADGDQTCIEVLEKVVHRARARGGLPGDGMDHRELILAAMGQLPEQQTKLVLVRLALASVERTQGRARFELPARFL